MTTTQEKILKYFDRDPKLKVLFIFNNEDMAVELANVSWPEGYRYVDFKGDWFTTKYKLDNEWADERVVMLFHQESPLEYKWLQESFPLMDVLVANMEYHNNDYAAFMQQYGIPRSMAGFVETNVKYLSTEKMMKMLGSYYADHTISEDVGNRAIICSYIGVTKVYDWDNVLLKIILLSNDDGKILELFNRLDKNPDVRERLNAKFNEIFHVGFNRTKNNPLSDIINSFKYNAMVQSLAPAKGDNYKKYRIVDSIALEKLNRILELAQTNDQTTQELNNIFDTIGRDIVENEILVSYGTEAKYYFISYGLCIPILKNLMKEKMESDPDYVIRRLDDLRLGNISNTEIDSLCSFIRISAQFYSRKNNLGSIRLDTAQEYVTLYEDKFFLIDQYYRKALETYFKIDPSAKLFDTAQETKKKLDADYMRISNELNLEWSKCLKDTGGFKNINLRRQQNFYTDNIESINKKVAVIISDALRYEVAQELLQQMIRRKHEVRLDMALAMLPTETKFTKLSTFPYDELSFNNEGEEPTMYVNGTLLDSTAKRSSYIGTKVKDAICVDFQEVAKYDREKNREIFKNPLVYIMHNTIDEKSHSASAADVVNSCSEAIQEIDKLVHTIHETYNVSQVYITSDHGFLFNDIEFKEKDKLKVNDEYYERKTRYYLTKDKSEVMNIIKFPLPEVSEMKGTDDVYVGVPEGVNRLAAQAGGYMFTHGGAALQEILIPVLTSSQARDEKKKNPVGVVILGKSLSIQASRLRLQILQTEAVSTEMKERTVTCAIYEQEKAVTPVKTIVLDKTDVSLDNRKIPVDLTLTVPTDAKILELRIYDIDDNLNPLCKTTVTNNTLIENDFDF